MIQTRLRIALTAASCSLFIACSSGDGGGGTGPEKPTVLITAPQHEATVSGVITVSTTATAADRVRFLIDDQVLGEAVASPFNLSWDTSQVSDGAHTVQAVAEGAGGTAEDAVLVTVDNSQVIDPGGTATLGAALAEMVSGSRRVASLGADGVELVAQAVFEASIQNGNQLTATGTLTQVPGTENFTWTNSPGDKLVIIFTGGARIDLFVTAFTGDFDNGWEGFRDFHSNLAFRAISAGTYDLTVQSQSGAPSGVTTTASQSAPAGLTQFGRTISGTVQFNQAELTVSLTNTGQVDAEFGSSVDYRSTETTSGSLSSIHGSVEVSESFDYRFLSVSNAIEQWTQTNSSRVTVKGEVYELRGGFIRGTCKNNLVSELDYWRAEGTLHKNGEAIGSVQFDSPPFVDQACPGPRAVVRLNSGEKLPL